MLPRAALRAASMRHAAPIPLRIAVPSATCAPQTRRYAHFGGSGPGPKKPGNYKPSNASAKRPTTFTQSSAQQQPGERKAKDQDFLAAATETPEFNQQASPLKNTTPKSQPGPGARDVKGDGVPAGASQDNLQSAKETPELNEQASSAQNTAPKSQPGPGAPTGSASSPSSSPPSEATSPEPQAPSKPLPDLRQGIPSTFAEEFLKQAEGSQPQATKGARDENERSESQKLDDEIADLKRQEAEQASAEPASGGRGGGGELPRSAYETSTDKRRNKIMNYTYLSMLFSGVTLAVYFGRNWDTDEEEKAHLDAPSGWDLGNFWGRIKARYNDSMGYYTEPTFPQLLPTMDPPPPYTLVLSLEDLMIHSEWTRQHGYRTAKRPGLDYFIRYLSQYYEIVLFTSLPMSQAELVYRKLDPYHIIMWPLFREATRYHNGEYIKDLSYLNRDLSKTIILDTKASHVSANPDNAIILPPWKGDPKDRDLVSYVPFLENIAAMGYPDVRKAIKSFEGQHIPTEFARREAELRKQFRAQLDEGRGRRPRFSLGGVLNKGLGIKAQPAPGSMVVGDDGSTASEGFERGLMLSDQIRERGRKQYEALEKEIRDNGEKWLKDMEEEEKKAQEEAMKGMKSNAAGVMGWFGGGAQPEPRAESAEASK